MASVFAVLGVRDCCGFSFGEIINSCCIGRFINSEKLGLGDYGFVSVCIIV